MELGTHIAPPNIYSLYSRGGTAAVHSRTSSESRSIRGARRSKISSEMHASTKIPKYRYAYWYCGTGTRTAVPVPCSCMHDPRSRTSTDCGSWLSPLPSLDDSASGQLRCPRVFAGGQQGGCSLKGGLPGSCCLQGASHVVLSLT